MPFAQTDAHMSAWGHENIQDKGQPHPVGGDFHPKEAEVEDYEMIPK